MASLQSANGGRVFGNASRMNRRTGDPLSSRWLVRLKATPPRYPGPSCIASIAS